MHLCLSCNQPCNLSSIFCESCRLALLERRAEEKAEEQPQMVKAGGGDGLAHLVSQPLPAQLPPEEVEGVTSQTDVGAGLPLASADDENWPLATSGLYEAEKAREESVATVRRPSVALPEASVPTARSRMPRRIRVALLVFVIVGVLALSVDGVLLALSIGRHHIQGGVNTLAVQGTVQRVTGSDLTPLPTGAGGVKATPTKGQGTLDTMFTLSSSRLLFTLSQGQADPAPQMVTLSSNGQDTFAWQIPSTAGLPAWLRLSALQGTIPPGGSAQLAVGVLAQGMATGTYTASVQVAVSNGQGQQLANSPQTLSVTLSVMIPCTLAVTPGVLSFNANLLQPAPAAQKLTFTHNGDCSLPIRWNISANAPWVTFTSTSGVDTGGGGTTMVSASNPGKVVDKETATLTLQATDAQNTPLSVTPATVTVTLTVFM